MELLKMDAVPMLFNLVRSINGSYVQNKTLIDQALLGYKVDPNKKDKEEEIETAYDWTDKVAKNYSKTLTEKQLKFLKFAKDNNNKITSKDVYNKIFNDHEKPGLVLAGVTSCLTRKCQSFDIPALIFWDKDDSCYRISKEAYPSIIKFL